MNPIAKRVLIVLPAVSLLLAFGALASGEPVDALLRRYPYDPACAWGRIGNGKGLIVRCLSEAEAQALRSAVAAGALPAASASASAGTVQAIAVPAPTVTPVTTEEPAEPDAGAPLLVTDEKLDVTVGPVTADSGTLGIGKLGAPKDRYVKCVTDNGGLKEATGEVQVRFMLRAKGRAEGVSVAKRSAVTTEAARCVSEIVDRRFVGVPDAPIVGATVVIKFARPAK